MKKNPNINKYNKGLYSVSHLKPNDIPYGMPNMKYNPKALKASRAKLYKKQTEKYGFTENETYALDYTASVWLYSHIKMMLDIGGKIVDYDQNFCWTPEFKQKLIDAGVDVEKYNTELLVFEYICSLIEEADKIYCTHHDLDELGKALELNRKAFIIFALMLHRVGW